MFSYYDFELIFFSDFVSEVEPFVHLKAAMWQGMLLISSAACFLLPMLGFQCAPPNMAFIQC